MIISDKNVDIANFVSSNSQSIGFSKKVATNNFFDVMNIVSSKNSSLLKTNNEIKTEVKKDFKSVLESSNVNRQSKVQDKNEKVDVKNQDNNKNEVNNNVKNDNSKEEKVDNKDAKEISKEDVLQKGNVKQEDDNEQIKFGDLSAQDKQFVSEIAEKLNVDQQTVLNLLQALNINFNDIKQKDIEPALIQIKSSLGNFLTTAAVDVKPLAEVKTEVNNNKTEVEKVEEKPIDVDIKSKIKLAIEIHNNTITKDKTAKVNVQDGQNDVVVNPIHLDNKMDSDKKVDKNDHKTDSMKLTNDTPVETAKAVIKPTEVLKKSDENNQDENVDLKGNQNKIVDNKQVDNSKNATIQNIFANAKVVNLKTVNKVEVENFNIQNIIQPQQQTTEVNKSFLIKNSSEIINNQKDNVFGQIVENAKLVLTDNQTEMELNLKPESLGKLSLKIATENGLVMAKFTAESQQVKEIIESNLIQLKEALKEQGLNVQQFSVSVGQDSKREMFNNQRFSGAKLNNKSVSLNSNTVMASESYVNRQMIKNPYLVSQSSFDYTA